MKTYKTSQSPDNRVACTIKCPLTGELLVITRSYERESLKMYPYFIEILLDEFNTGEQDCNIIVKKTILTFFEQYPYYLNKFFVYMVMLHFTSIFRCPGLPYRPQPVFFYWALARKDFLTEAAYRSAPPDFKLYLSQLRNPIYLDQFRAAQFVHNCVLIVNRIDSFVYALDEDTFHGQVALPYYNFEWCVKWVFFNVQELIDDGLLVIQNTGPIIVDEETHDTLQAYKEGRPNPHPSRFGIEPDK